MRTRVALGGPVASAPFACTAPRAVSADPPRPVLNVRVGLARTVLE